MIDLRYFTESHTRTESSSRGPCDLGEMALTSVCGIAPGSNLDFILRFRLALLYLCSLDRSSLSGAKGQYLSLIVSKSRIRAIRGHGEASSDE